ncbi:hypothetical protein HKX48_003879 [Thoreauomyces humboldtii]|nr:hypothetical protein HKX48_003879 [Thoreauomyces humboldtii]
MLKAVRLRASRASTICRRWASTHATNPADFQVDHLVIGAGVVGLAIAERLSRRPSTTTLLIDRNASFGMETSSRNSEVIHAGLYYPPDSLKTRLCIRGNRLMYGFCEENHVPCKRIGKWIVATQEDQVGVLRDMEDRARNLGVEVRMVDLERVKREEPNVIAKAVLESPSTGIVDSHALMACLEAKLESHGTDIAYHTLVASCAPHPSTRGYIVTTADQTTIHAKTLINSAGLSSDTILNSLRPSTAPRIHPCKGVYYSMTGAPPPVKRLVYPVPEKSLKGLGIHATVDMSGRVKFGPDATYVDSKTDLDIKEDNEVRDRFASAIARYLRGVDPEHLNVDYAGMRPKLSGPGDPFQDFRIEVPSGLPGFVNLTGIESPGLTASLAIAEMVEKLLDRSSSLDELA